MHIRRSNFIRFSAAMFLSLAAGVAAFNLEINPFLTKLLSVFLVATLMLMFFHLGQFQIEPATIFALSFFLVFAFPSAFIGFTVGHSAYESSATISLSISLLAFFIWSKNLSQNKFNLKTCLPNANVLLYFQWPIIFLYFVFLFLFFNEEFLIFFWRHALSFFPPLFFLIGLFFWTHKKMMHAIKMFIFASAAWLVYYFFAFEGFGRINIAASLLAIVILASWMRPSYKYKIGIFLAVVPGLMWTAIIRSTDSDINIKEVFIRGSGLGSVMSPFNDLALIIKEEKLAGIYVWQEWFDQLIGGLFFWVPREWWQSKPEGFGRLIVYKFLPYLEDTTHSMAGSVFGEGIAYFDYLGFVFGVSVIIFMASIIGFLFKKLMQQPAEVIISFFPALAIAMAQIITLVWGGTFSYLVRSLPSFMVAGIVIIFLFFYKNLTKIFKK